MPPPAIKLLPLLQKLKETYLLWYSYYQILPKLHRHSLGQKIDSLFIESIEAISIASYLPRDEKQPWVRLGIRKIDTLKILLMMLWETKSLDNKKYIALSLRIDEIGRMLGGWNGQLTKQNSPRYCRREMRRFATQEHPTVVSIPDIVRVVVVHVEPLPIVVVFDVEHVEVAIRVRVMYKISSVPLPLDNSRDCIVFGILMP